MRLTEMFALWRVRPGTEEGQSVSFWTGPRRCLISFPPRFSPPYTPCDLPPQAALPHDALRDLQVSRVKDFPPFPKSFPPFFWLLQCSSPHCGRNFVQNPFYMELICPCFTQGLSCPWRPDSWSSLNPRSDTQISYINSVSWADRPASSAKRYFPRRQKRRAPVRVRLSSLSFAGDGYGRLDPGGVIPFLLTT